MDSTYAPQSPDLSGLLASPSKQLPPHPHVNQQSYQTSQLQQYQPTSQSSSYTPRSPVIPAFNSVPPQAHSQGRNAYQANQQTAAFSARSNEFGDSYGGTQYMPPIPTLPPSHSFNPPQTTAQSRSTLHHQPPSKSNNIYSPYAPAEADYAAAHNMSSRGPRQLRGQNQGQAAASSSSSQSASQQAYKDPNPHNIEIKTKFPVARIKRIMQADEEVGKVAQVTPVAVSKALELFMISLVSGAAEKAKEKGGKRVTAQHLKQVVLGSPEQFDFLADIVGRVSDNQEGAGGEAKKRKGEKTEGSESSEEEPKKPKKGKGRRKKSDD
ncbi:Uncharacterized protein BP5553_04889 [Venustampulla echinocandica]|uniref:NCT transcriptional regulatory complex subunit A n=1 Tax=Venustampulla echinocandica TaxID=2656787 RepID=A0A370TPK8_9HELO|nr:Uncharacterized protein BP5553_04889 [Venustampulla echinocandica]RDL37456.1 Uncharacterized protein BP5553_04889 [Venustampulla echinocandica]